MNVDRRKALRSMLNEKRGMLVPGAANALAASVIADLGFDAVYVSGAGVTNTSLGLPDLGFIGLSDLAQHTAAIRDAVDVPIIVDADAGFGNAVNVWQSVRVLERAGADAIQFEDQVMPKRCGHFLGKAVIPLAEMRAKIQAAVDARRDENFLIIARTDARQVEGFEAAVERANAFVEAGADATFVEALETVDEIRRLPELVPSPQVINIVIGGRTPILDAAELTELRYSMVLYANAALQGAIAGMQAALRELKSKGMLDESSAAVANFQERQRLVRKSHFDELDKRYAT